MNGQALDFDDNCYYMSQCRLCLYSLFNESAAVALVLHLNFYHRITCFGPLDVQLKFIETCSYAKQHTFALQQ